MDRLQKEKILSLFRIANKTTQLNRCKIEECVTAINDLICESQYKNNQKITNSDIKFTDHFVRDIEKIKRRWGVKKIWKKNKQNVKLTISSNRTLSDILFNIYFPIPDEEYHYHYTKISALRHILKGNLKLKPILYNENYDEFKTFYIDHDLQGYWRKEFEGKTLEKTLMGEIYSFCMASKNDLTETNEHALWSSFGDNGNGVRIEFKIQTDHPDFRKVFYKDTEFNSSELLINRINVICKEKYERQLFVSGISKMGAFYLPGSYHIENEVRFLIKKDTDQYEFEFDDSNGYIILPFSSKYAKFEIHRIKIGSLCTKEQIDEILNLIREKGYSDEVIE